MHHEVGNRPTSTSDATPGQRRPTRTDAGTAHGTTLEAKVSTPLQPNRPASGPDQPVVTTMESKKAKGYRLYRAGVRGSPTRQRSSQRGPAHRLPPGPIRLSWPCRRSGTQTRSCQAGSTHPGQQELSRVIFFWAKLHGRAGRGGSERERVRPCSLPGPRKTMSRRQGWVSRGWGCDLVFACFFLSLSVRVC